MSCGPYVPTIRAEFGRTITEPEINQEFEEIERIMKCMEAAVDNETTVIDNVVDLGTVTDETVISSINGVVQYMTIEGGIELNVATPDDGDPRLITLVMADGGNGLFNFPVGQAWSTDSNGSGFDGKPWNAEWAVGDYGALVTCIYDGDGWVFIVFARNEIDYAKPLAEVEDVYNWR